MEIKKILVSGLLIAGISACAVTPQNPNADPNAPAQNIAKADNMVIIGCDKEATTKAGEATAAATVGIKNNALKPIKVYGIDKDGKRVAVTTIPEATQQNVNTSVNSPILIASQDDKCLGIYSPNAAVGATIIQSSY